MNTLRDDYYIRNLVGDQADPQAVYKFRGRQWEYLQDKNTSSTYSGRIEFDTQSVRTRSKLWHNAFIAVPVRVAGPTEAQLCAFKQSYLSFVESITCKFNNVPVVDDQDVTLINNLRLMLEKSVDWAAVNGPEIGFAMDTNNDQSADCGTRLLTGSAFAGATSGAATTTAIAFTTVNPLYNDGFFKRAAYFQGIRYTEANNIGTLAAVNKRNWHDATSAGLMSNKQADFRSDSYTNDTYNTVIKLPLNLLHPFFNALDFPVMNDEMQLTIGYNISTTSKVAPMQVPTGVTDATLTVQGPCRLYYEAVEWFENDVPLVEHYLSENPEKVIRYRKSITKLSLANTSANVSVSMGSAITRPKRVAVMMYPAGALADQNPSLAPGCCNGGNAYANVGMLTSNVRVNNRNIYNADLNNEEEHWNVLRRNLDHIDDNQSLINRHDWVNLHHGIMVYDLTDNDKLINHASGNEVVVNFTKNSQYDADGTGGLDTALSLDIATIVEFEEVVTLKMSSGSMTVRIQ